MFAASGISKVSRCVDSWLAGIRFWHVFNGAVWNGYNCEMLNKLKVGVSKMTPVSAKRPRRLPVTVEHMHALYRGLDLTNTFDSAVFSCTTAAFCGCTRLGELPVPGRNAFIPSKHVARGARRSFGRVRNGAAFVSFHIPWTKTTKEEGADIVLTSVRGPLNPAVVFRHHLSANALVPNNAPLFAFETSAGGWAPMTKPWFMERVSEVWKAAGLNHALHGHGFLIGGASELLVQGVPPDVVATQGRWKSRAFLEYWRRIEAVVLGFSLLYDTEFYG
jgi:hypothetical protein